MATFVVVQGQLWGSKSFPILVAQKDLKVEATNIRSAANEVIRQMAGRVPKGARIKRVILDVVRVE